MLCLTHTIVNITHTSAGGRTSQVEKMHSASATKWCGLRCPAVMPAQMCVRKGDYAAACFDTVSTVSMLFWCMQPCIDECPCSIISMTFTHAGMSLCSVHTFTIAKYTAQKFIYRPTQPNFSRLLNLHTFFFCFDHYKKLKFICRHIIITIFSLECSLYQNYIILKSTKKGFLFTAAIWRLPAKRLYTTLFHNKMW